MRHSVARRVVLALALVLAPSALAYPGAGAKQPAGEKLATVEVKLADALVAKSKGIRTLYITVFDAESKMPMPYGAMKVELEKDAKGLVYKGDLDQTNVMVMGGGDAPKTLRIKARLDKDGSAGPDEAGDLVGLVDKVARGSTAVVTIDKAF